MPTNLQASFHPRSPFNKICHPSPDPNASYIPIFTCVEGANAEIDSIDLANSWTCTLIFCSAFQEGVTGAILTWSCFYAFSIQSRNIFWGADRQNLESLTKLDTVTQQYLKLAQGHRAITPGLPQHSYCRLSCIHDMKGPVNASLEESIIAFYFNS